MQLAFSNPRPQSSHELDTDITHIFSLQPLRSDPTTNLSLLTTCVLRKQIVWALGGIFLSQKIL